MPWSHTAGTAGGGVGPADASSAAASAPVSRSSAAPTGSGSRHRGRAPDRWRLATAVTVTVLGYLLVAAVPTPVAGLILFATGVFVAVWIAGAIAVCALWVVLAFVLRRLGYRVGGDG